MSYTYTVSGQEFSGTDNIPNTLVNKQTLSDIIESDSVIDVKFIQEKPSASILNLGEFDL